MYLVHRQPGCSGAIARRRLLVRRNRSAYQYQSDIKAGYRDDCVGSGLACNGDTGDKKIRHARTGAGAGSGSAVAIARGLCDDRMAVTNPLRIFKSCTVELLSACAELAPTLPEVVFATTPVCNTDCAGTPTETLATVSVRSPPVLGRVTWATEGRVKWYQSLTL